MERRHKVVDFIGHYRQHRHRLIPESRESVHRSRGNLNEISLMKHTALDTHEHFEIPRNHAEGFVGRIVNMRWRLIARIRLQMPTFQNEVRHVSHSTVATFTSQTN